MMTTLTYQEFSTQVLAQFQQDVALLFDSVCLPEPLNQACRYAMSGLGKRARPLLVAASFYSVSNTDDMVRHAMMRRACLAVELLHAYSLVHDDLPCMDNSALRRGQATCHIAYGEDVALLVGDVLQSLAFEVLTMPLQDLACDPQLAAKLVTIFAPRTRRMVTGQMLDLLGEAKDLSQAELETIHRDKTGALIEAAVLMGGVAAHADAAMMANLGDYARRLGLAFQVQDDVLDATMDTQILGKPAGHDEKLQKSTYVKHLGAVGAKNYADTLFAEAYQAAYALKQLCTNTLSIVGHANALLALGAWVQARQR